MEKGSERSSYSVDPYRLRRLLDENLVDFSRNFGQSPIEELQDLRALLIAWVAVFLPEIVSKSFFSNLELFVLKLRKRNDFKHHGWFDLLPLDIALFALTNKKEWLDIHRQNLDHHKQQLRNYLIKFSIFFLGFSNIFHIAYLVSLSGYQVRYLYPAWVFRCTLYQLKRQENTLS